MYKKIIVIIISLCSFQDTSFAFDAKNGHIKIESEKLDVSITEGKAQFTGNVMLKQNNLSINSDKLILFFQKEKIIKAIFIDNVKIYMEGQMAFGNKGEYLQDKQILKLTGDVYLMQNNNKVSGDLFIYNMKTKEVKVTVKQEQVSKNKKKRIKIKLKKNVDS